ncbi:DedA family protein [Lederbergia wuyishanensis]|uniref:Membrane protein DedA with SNARE-associated domain n=1 Tax=Lederbergia wuyishanensis TaxID=1347903 RepID=A0ABU0D6J0_9BACI|nr:VTT domain-containing protein [Lederbergia wuyishanensis]MCJ8008555.1 VTT domain-containing protein [Lederbergia wuyishanensis]MDQ0344031.1 membrane protein DedA with SNARE-associated domain [Lederbergia wuyishanensis]
MIQQFLEWLNTIGFPGLFIVMFLEGSSLPFPGLIIVLSYGYVLSPGYIQTIFLAMGMAISYSLSSLIPYFLGQKLENYFPVRFKKGLEKGTAFFTRYGIWSIALSRPFGIGNYISYVAGMSKVNVLKYLILTFIGIYPWSYVMVLLGDYFNGNYEEFKSYFSSFGIYGYGIAAIAIITIFTLYKLKLKKRILPEGGHSN